MTQCKVAEIKTIEIKVIREDNMYNRMLDVWNFYSSRIFCPPQFVFDLPHGRALNFFFVLNIVVGKTSYDRGIEYLFTSILGYAKYSLENVEKENLNMLKQKNKIKIYCGTRKFGILFFNASYKF